MVNFKQNKQCFQTKCFEAKVEGSYMQNFMFAKITFLKHLTITSYLNQNHYEPTFEITLKTSNQGFHKLFVSGCPDRGRRDLTKGETKNFGKDCITYTINTEPS